MYLFHGTTVQRLSSIGEIGLCPNMAPGRRSYEALTAGKVYLTKNLPSARSFAQDTWNKDNLGKSISFDALDTETCVIRVRCSAVTLTEDQFSPGELVTRGVGPDLMEVSIGFSDNWLPLSAYLAQSSPKKNVLQHDTFTKEELTIVMDRLWRQMVAFPNAQVCKHHAAVIVLQEMERLGIAPPPDIIGAVVDADDESALAWRRDGSTDEEEVTAFRF